MDKRDQETILSSIDDFFDALHDKGYSESTIRDEKSTLIELPDFFSEFAQATNTEFIDQFIHWKINRRSQKKYHCSYKSRRKKSLNQFFTYYLKTNKSLHYSRKKFEKYIPEFVERYKSKDKRAPIDMRNNLLAFFDYLERKGINRIKKGDGEPINQQLIADFLDDAEQEFYKNRERYCDGYENHIRALMLKFHEYLLSQNHASFYLPSPKPSREPLHFEAPIEFYLEYLDKSCALSQSSIGAAARELKKIDLFLQSKSIKTLNKIKITHIDEHVTNQIKPGNLHAIHNLNSILRRFFKFLFVTSQIKKDLAKYISAAPLYRLSEVPKNLSEREVKAVLSFSKPLSESDLKKKAVLSLLMFNGLRVGEVAKLTLDDIDWDEQVIAVTKRKNRQALITPMSDYVKASLMEYVSKARPNNYSSREIFLSENAPIKPISSRGITQMMRRRLQKKGITCGGAHRMRHTFGTYLLESDSSIEEAQLLLGHKQVNATRIYGKSSMKRMREHVVENEI